MCYRAVLASPVAAALAADRGVRAGCLHGNRINNASLLQAGD